MTSIIHGDEIDFIEIKDCAEKAYFIARFCDASIFFSDYC